MSALLAEYFLEDFCARNNFRAKKLDDDRLSRARNLSLARQCP